MKKIVAFDDDDIITKSLFDEISQNSVVNFRTVQGKEVLSFSNVSIVNFINADRLHGLPRIALDVTSSPLAYIYQDANGFEEIGAKVGNIPTHASYGNEINTSKVVTRYIIESDEELIKFIKAGLYKSPKFFLDIFNSTLRDKSFIRDAEFQVREFSDGDSTFTSISDLSRTISYTEETIPDSLRIAVKDALISARSAYINGLSEDMFKDAISDENNIMISDASKELDLSGLAKYEKRKENISVSDIIKSGLTHSEILNLLRSNDSVRTDIKYEDVAGNVSIDDVASEDEVVNDSGKVVSTNSTYDVNGQSYEFDDIDLNDTLEL